MVSDEVHHVSRSSGHRDMFFPDSTHHATRRQPADRPVGSFFLFPKSVRRRGLDRTHMSTSFPTPPSGRDRQETLAEQLAFPCRVRALPRDNCNPAAAGEAVHTIAKSR